MHVSKFVIDNVAILVNHNSDWSGEANIAWRDSDGELQVRKIPGELLLKLGEQAAREYLRDKLINFLDQD